MHANDPTLDLPHPLRERVELIVHLLKFSDRLFAIMSPATDELQGFAELLIEEGGPGLLFARIHPDLALTAEDLAADLARAWGIALELGESALQAIPLRLPALIPEPRRAVAIVEDVERLPAQALDEFIAFIQQLDAQTGGRVRLVLLGGPNLAALLQTMPSLEAGGQVYALHLAPPPAEAFADIATGAAIDSAPILERSTSAPTAVGTGPLSSRTLLIGGVAASLTLAVVLALLMRPGEPEKPKDQQVSVPLKSETVASQTVAPLPPPQPVANEPAPPTPAAPVGHQLTESAPVVIPPPTPAPAPVEVKPSLPAPMAEPKAEVKPSPAATAPATEAKPTAPAAKPAPAAPPAKKPSNWYAQQKGEQYVLQVVSIKTEAEAERFIKQYGLKDCHSFRQVRDGQTLHTVTCGLYPNREAASQALAKLPEKARAGKPFPRKIDDIRRIMQP